jgi:hypothetical protein
VGVLQASPTAANTSEAPQPFVDCTQHPAMEISNPRRILAVGAPDSGVLFLLKGELLSSVRHKRLKTNLPLS